MDKRRETDNASIIETTRWAAAQRARESEGRL